MKTNRAGKQVCQGCGICIEPDYMETRAYQVGDYQICGWCLRSLKRHGGLLIEPYNQYLYLYPNGEVRKEKVLVGEEDDRCKTT